MKKVWYLLASSLMLFAACGDDDDDDKQPSKAYNVKSVVCTYFDDETQQMEETMRLSYEYADGKVTKLIVDMSEFIYEEISFDYVSETEANVVMVAEMEGMGTSQMTGTASFDAKTHALTKMVANDFETTYTYNESNQLVSEVSASQTLEYGWTNGNLVSCEAGTIAYSDVKNNTNFDFGKLFSSSEMPDGLSISQLIGTVSVNIPSALQDDEDTYVIETTLDSKNRPATLHLTINSEDESTITITYCD